MSDETTVIDEEIVDAPAEEVEATDDVATVAAPADDATTDEEEVEADEDEDEEDEDEEEAEEATEEVA